MPGPSAFHLAVQALRPGVNFSNSNNTLAGIRWDTPGVTPPTQVEVDAEIARQAAIADRISVERLYFMLEVAGVQGLKAAIEALLDQLAQAGNEVPRVYWQNAKVFESDHPLMLQLGGHETINMDAEDIRALCASAYAKQLAGAA